MSPLERATIVKFAFTRWLPAIAKTEIRHAALTVAGLVFIGGGLAGPATAAQATPTVNHAALSALKLAVGEKSAGQIPNQPQPLDQLAAKPATQPGGKPQSGGRPQPAGTAAAPSMDKLVPLGTQGPQSSIPLSDQQLANATAIVSTAKKTGVGERGAVIGVATALQESKLNNYGHLGAINDHDSLGLFQQRPSAGWGTPEQIMSPDYAATEYFTSLKQIAGWQDMPLTVAAQQVQVSAYPFAYAQWEQQAADIVQTAWTK
jgi:hypothetical protein